MGDGSERAALFAAVVGQGQAVEALRAAAVRPVHAYLFVGPPGTGKAAAARGFAAALLCRSLPADGTCETCRRVLEGVHPDVINFEREGAAIGIDTAREVTRLASTSPVEGNRKVLILHDFHLVKEAGPALLKTIEEPPASTIFVIMAEYVPPELITIASRCVRIDFDLLTPAEVAATLVSEGVPVDQAADLAAASGGRLDRARLLATDKGFEARRAAWQSVPARLDGLGATAAALADELYGLLESSVEPLRARHEAERVALEERNAKSVDVTGRGGGRAGSRAVKAMLNSGIGELENRQRRELRRQRTDELRSGLATLAGAYRDRLAEAVATGLVAPAGTPADGAAGPGATDRPYLTVVPPPGAGGGSSAAARRRDAALAAIDRIDKLGRDLLYNPGELIQLQGLLVRLGRAGL
jgi:DNA polymerase-3 subunit delta'